MKQDAPARFQDIIGPLCELGAGFDIPVMEDVAEEHGIAPGGPGIVKHVGREGSDPILEAEGGDDLASDCADWLKVQEDTTDVRVVISDG